MDKNMIDEKEILFVTTTLNTKWLKYQSGIIKKLFPNSEHLIINGSAEKWPNSWFYWIDKVKNSDKKYYIHLDEDFFITSKSELIGVIEKMETDGIDMIGCPDGYHHYRGANPVSFNSFFMIGRISDIKKIDIDFEKIRIGMASISGSISWINNYDLNFKESYKEDFNYPFKIQGGSNYLVNQEPYYAFIWKMKEIGCKFGYLFPYFDERFKSTNPRISEDSEDIGIHMWYTRNWNNSEDVHGMKNIDRYNVVEKFILENLLP